jgi:hypothetical protein
MRCCIQVRFSFKILELLDGLISGWRSFSIDLWSFLILILILIIVVVIVVIIINIVLGLVSKSFS